MLGNDSGQSIFPSYADKFKIFIFHRTLYTPKVAKLIEKAKKFGNGKLFLKQMIWFLIEIYVRQSEHYQKNEYS